MSTGVAGVILPPPLRDWYADPGRMKAFAEQVVRTDWQGHPYEIQAHHLEWWQHLHDSQMLLLLAARGHSKTETLVVLPILWLAYHCSDILIYLVSVSQEQANKILARIKRCIERSMPMLKDPMNWAKQEIRTTHRVTIVAKGFMTSIIGPHPHFIFVDDPIEDRQSHSDSALESWFFADLFPMLMPNGQLVVDGTYKHYNDLFHKLQERGLFDVHVYPAERDDGTLLWPEYWTRELLNERRAALGSVLYAREYMLQPVDDTSAMVPRSLISEAFDATLPLLKKSDGVLEPYVGVDPAASGSVGADYSVFSILGVDPDDGHITMMNQPRDRGMTLKQHIAMLGNIDDAYEPVHVKIEKNAFQRWLQQEASGILRQVPITGHNTGKEKSDLREGVPSLALLFERGEITIPRGPTAAELKNGVPAHEWESVRVTEPLVHELSSMTWEDGKITSVAKHDDCVMALWLAVMAIREGRKQRGIAMTTVETRPASRKKKRASQFARGRRL